MFQQTKRIEPSEPIATKSSGVSNVVDDLFARKPDVSEHVIASNEPTETVNPTSQGPVDKHGRTFNPNADPQIHEINADGTPRISLRGKLCIKPGNRKKKDTAPATPTTNQQSSLNIPGSQAPPDDAPEIPGHIRSGKTLANMFFMVWVGQVGMEKGMPESTEEREQVEGAIIRQCEASEVENVPPWLDVAGALGMYSLKRLQEPVMVEKRVRVMARIKIWYLKRQLKKNKITHQQFEDVKKDLEANA